MLAEHEPGTSRPDRRLSPSGADGQAVKQRVQDRSQPAVGPIAPAGAGECEAFATVLGGGAVRPVY